MLADTIKVNKKARKMLGVKTLRQESENSGKPGSSGYIIMDSCGFSSGPTGRLYLYPCKENCTKG